MTWARSMTWVVPVLLLAACERSSGSGDDLAAGGADLAVANDLATGGGGNCGTYKYCDDFESYGGAVANGAPLGPWLASVAGVTMQVDAVNAYQSGKSLHITVPTGATAHGTLNQKAGSGLVAGNDLFGRAMVFYSSAGGNGLPLNVHSWIFSSGGVSTEGDGGSGNVSMNMGGGGAKLQLNYHPPAPLTEQSVQGGLISAGAWHCLQWEYNGAGTPPADDAKVWIDGKLAVDVPASKGWRLATPWDTFDFGFTHYQTLANTVEIVLDDFALDGAMIPCP